MLLALITGSMGSGKSTTAGFLKARSCPVFQADAYSKKLLKIQSPCYDSLKRLFGGQCLSPSGDFDRKKLAKEVFKSVEKRKAMEAIIHPLVRESFKKFLEKQKKRGEKRVFYEIPLISRDIFNSFDKRILLTCPKDIKKKRLMQKGWDLKDIESRWAVQIPESEIRDKVDFVIDNSGDLKSLSAKVDEILLSI